MLYEIVDRPSLQDPVLVVALSGWVDAASAGTGAAAHLATEGSVVARFDPDALFDYRSQRPILDIVEGEMTRTVWPEVILRHSKVADRDVLVLTGSEPDFGWHGFCDAVAELASSLGVARHITLGSVPAAVPHTLPPPVMTTASDRALLQDEAQPPSGLLRVPAAAVSMIDQRVASTGIPTVGFFVQVPHYVSGEYPSGVLALLERLARHVGWDMPLESFREEARAHRAQLDDAVAAQPEAREHIAALESMSADQNVVSGEQLASEIERYLREESAGERNPFEEEGE